MSCDAFAAAGCTLLEDPEGEELLQDLVMFTFCSTHRDDVPSDCGLCFIVAAVVGLSHTRQLARCTADGGSQS